MKPNVLIMIDTYAIGGPGKLILQFLKNGGKELCSPIVAGFWRGSEKSWEFREAVESIKVRFETLHQRSGFDPSVIRDAYLLARKSDIQILESHGYKAHVVCLVLSRLLKIPWVAYVHGWTSENLKVGLYNRLEKWIIRYADRIVPVSKNLGTRLDLNERDREKLVTIPNAIDRADISPVFSDVRKQLGVQNGDRLIGVIGRLSPEKGHGLFIEAFREVLSVADNIRAVFVGDGQELNTLTALIQENALADRIFLAGYQKDVSGFYQACDIIVLPSLSEGMPMVALEAMSFAKPVIATRVGGIPEVVVDDVTGLLVDPLDHKALAKAIVKLLGDEKKMEEYGFAGRLRVDREFDPMVRAKKVMDMYESLLKKV